MKLFNFASHQVHSEDETAAALRRWFFDFLRDQLLWIRPSLTVYRILASLTVLALASRLYLGFLGGRPFGSPDQAWLFAGELLLCAVAIQATGCTLAWIERFEGAPPSRATAR